jgi:hypothetical protein
MSLLTILIYLLTNTLFNKNKKNIAMIFQKLSEVNMETKMQ